MLLRTRNRGGVGGVGYVVVPAPVAGTGAVDHLPVGGFLDARVANAGVAASDDGLGCSGTAVLGIGILGC